MSDTMLFQHLPEVHRSSLRRFTRDLAVTYQAICEIIHIEPSKRSRAEWNSLACWCRIHLIASAQLGVEIWPRRSIETHEEDAIAALKRINDADAADEIKLHN